MFNNRNLQTASGTELAAKHATLSGVAWRGAALRVHQLIVYSLERLYVTCHICNHLHYSDASESIGIVLA